MLKALFSSPPVCPAGSQPCRARAPFVRYADIFPATGENHPRQRGPWAYGIRKINDHLSQYHQEVTS